MSDESRGTRSWFRTRSGRVLLAFLGIAAFFVITEHRAHLLGILPYLLLLACPLLHWLHGGHGGGHDGHTGRGETSGRRGEGGGR